MRKLKLAICDYKENIVCDIYDSKIQVSGQAYDVRRRKERNGWKELSFSIPSTCHTENGEEKNYRLQYLIADYLIRFEDEHEIDWYVISGPKVEHSAFSQDVNVTAGHISQRLKMKNLDLEFSDDEGNNTGTAEQLLSAVLEGTGWQVGNVVKFYEDDWKTEKIRSLQAPAKTGALKMVSDICDLFEAKPEFNGNKTVDIMPLNPFAREVVEKDGHLCVGKATNLLPGQIPDIVNLGDTNVYEIHYDHNMKGISRTLDTENIVTKLYAYGSYGNNVDGYCSLQKAKHNEYTINVVTPAVEHKFTDVNGVDHYFVAGEAGEYIYSDLDPMSQSYVWLNKAYRVTSLPTIPTEIPVNLGKINPESVENRFSYLMDFTYYDEVNLLTEEMFQEVAKFQREVPLSIIAAENASKALIEKEEEASIIGESMSGLAKLDIAEYSEKIMDGKSFVNVVLNQEATYREEPYVIYRTDYDENMRHKFTWHVVNEIKENGDPVSGTGSVLFIIHEPKTDESYVSWDMLYLHSVNNMCHEEIIDNVPKTIYDDYVYGRNQKLPEHFTIWANWEDIRNRLNIETDRVYLLCTKSMMGLLGSKQVEDEAAVQALASSTKTGTETHPTVFEAYSGSSTPTTDPEEVINEDSYGWCYLYYPENNDIGQLYFCYRNLGDDTWYKAYCQDEEPAQPLNGEYFFNTKTKELKHRENDTWALWDSVEDKRIANQFSKVNYYCLRRDMLYKGLYEKYWLTEQDTAGNYAVKTDFGFYWVFTTDRPNTKNPEPIIPCIDTTKYYVYQAYNTNNKRIIDVKNVVSLDTKPFDTVEHPSSNIVENANFTKGSINEQGVEIKNDSYKRSYNINIYELTDYDFVLPSTSKIFVYDQHKMLIQTINVITETGSFKSEKHAYYLRILMPVNSESQPNIHVTGYNNKIYVDDKLYTVINITDTEGPLKGINNLTKSFADLTDDAYQNYLPSLLSAQKIITDRTNELSVMLGDIYREGWWQDSDYVEEEVDKLYKDASDNLIQISRPEANYDIDFIDLYGSENKLYSIEEDDETKYPIVKTTDAVHLIDPEIDVNLWAYLDQVTERYDKDGETSISVNTNLSLIWQHSFTDVMSRIADVASQTKTRQVIYERASNIGSQGEISTWQLEGSIQTSVNKISGGPTNWHTDDQGAQIFESADGMSAMKISGSGWALSSSKDSSGNWEWRTAGTGSGIIADEIRTGILNANVIKAGSITADKLSSVVGQELEISSNKALELFATTDGTRPAGSLSVNNINTGDAIISIKAGDEGEDASIDIASGGSINMSGGQIYIGTKGSFKVETGGELEINTAGLKVNGDKATFEGTLNPASGTIGGFKIEKNTLIAPNEDIDENAGEDIIEDTDDESPIEPSFYFELNADPNDMDYAIAINDTNFRDVDEGEDPQTPRFYVEKDGTLHAKDAEIQGTIDAYIPGNKITGRIKTGLLDGNDNTYINILKTSMLEGNSGAETGKIKTSMLSGSIDGSMLSGNIQTSLLTGNISTSMLDGSIATSMLTGNFPTSRLDGNISTSKLDGNISTSKLEGSISTSMLTGTIATSMLTGNISTSILTGNFPTSRLEGDISADKISGGTFKVGNEDNSYGIIEAYDENDTKIGTWDKDGLNVDQIACKDVVQPASEDEIENVEDIDAETSVLDDLRPVSFNYTSDDTKRYGLVLEEAEEHIPELCFNNSFNYIELIPVLLKEIQNLRARVSALEPPPEEGE